MPPFVGMLLLALVLALCAYVVRVIVRRRREKGSRPFEGGGYQERDPQQGPRRME